MGRVLAWGALVCAVSWSATARAHGTFVVNTTADHDDGACELAPDGDCTLREAILGANALVNDHPDAPDTIGFDFGPGAQSPFTISLESPLPPVIEGASFNGGSEPRYIVSTDHVPVVIVDGGGFDHILELRADATLVIALAFTNAAVSAIDAEGADYVLVQGCYFGVDPQTGAPLHPSVASPAFGSHAIHVRDTFRPRIGGTSETSRNVFGGAGAEAILVERSDSLLLQGNFIGVDGTGFEARPNALTDSSAFTVSVFDSSSVDVWDNVISSGFGGGLQLVDVPNAAVERNLIGLDAVGRTALPNGATGLSIAGDVAGLAIFDSVIGASGGDGVACEAASDGPWRMERNLVGVDATQSDVVPNAGDGVRIESGCTGASVGSDRARNGNLIAHNEGAGVRSVDGTATIRSNTIFLNESLAIDTGAAGRNANDGAPGGPPVHHPDLGELELEEGYATVRACVAPGATVDVFEALLIDDATPVGAVRFLGSGVEGAEEDTDARSDCSEANDTGFELTVAVEAPVSAVVLTATVNGQTSELSDPFVPPVPVEPTGRCVSDIDCTVDAPICDVVFLRCVSCVDDKVDGEVDSGCLPERPSCEGDLGDRRCVEAAVTPAPPRQQPPSGSSGGCTVTPLGDSSWTVLVCLLVGLVGFRRKRNFLRSIY